MQLCEYCIESILESTESWDYHRCYACLKEGWEWTVPETAISPSDVKAAGKAQKKERCLFCSTLFHDVDEFLPGLRNHNGPIYRWTVRLLSRIRESLETVVVTFHPIPIPPPPPSQTVSTPSSILKEASLPTRTFYFFPEDLGPWPTPAQLGCSTNPQKNGGAQIKSWLSTCDETHTGCMKRRKAKSPSSRFVPTRLLDISGPPESPIKVIETTKTHVRSPYATLSHCWGPNKFVCLSPETKKHYIDGEGVPWQMLTKNFQEAIEVARFLEIEYIWIDSLCIIQGPEGDFPAEGGKMHQVYRNSYCNIAIVDSANDTGGLFREREPEDVAPVRYQPSHDGKSAMFGNKAWRVAASDVYESELLKTKLYVRGWVFQERMLAPRSLQFANRQIFWDCATISACEALPFGLPPPMDGPARPDRHWRGRLQEPEEKTEPLAGASDDPLLEFWKSAVRKFTSCALTNRGDKLIAIWGIAKLVRDGLGDEYGMGLWEQNLEDQLTWRVAECTRYERPTNSTPTGRDFPSWSWASMDGRIEVPDRLSKSNKPHWTARDHSGQPLRFDLIGVQRSLTSARPRLADASSPIQRRGNSDTVVEQKARYRELEKVSSIGKESQGKDVITGKVDRNDEPKFHSTSLPIAGHVGRGCLVRAPAQKGWLLRPEGFVRTEIEAFPDTIPKPDSLVDQEPFFVVLSAKQDVKSNAPDVMKPYELEDEEQDSDDEEVPRERVVTKEFDVSGIGILMKEVGHGRFNRTGAFRFQHISNEDWARLLEPEKIKFWLD